MHFFVYFVYCFAYIIFHISERNEQTLTKSCKTKSGSWSAKTSLHADKWKQGPCNQAVPAKQRVLCDAQADSVGLGQTERGLNTVKPMAEAPGLAWLHGHQPAHGAGRVGRHVPGARQGWLPSACKGCKDLKSSGHGLLKVIEKSARALICQELLLQVCPALTLFPALETTFPTSGYKYWVRQKLF